MWSKKKLKQEYINTRYIFCSFHLNIKLSSEKQLKNTMRPMYCKLWASCLYDKLLICFIDDSSFNNEVEVRQVLMSLHNNQFVMSAYSPAIEYLKEKWPVLMENFYQPEEIINLLITLSSINLPAEILYSFSESFMREILKFVEIPPVSGRLTLLAIDRFLKEMLEAKILVNSFHPLVTCLHQNILQFNMRVESDQFKPSIISRFTTFGFSIPETQVKLKILDDVLRHCSQFKAVQPKFLRPFRCEQNDKELPRNNMIQNTPFKALREERFNTSRLDTTKASIEHK